MTNIRYGFLMLAFIFGLCCAIAIAKADVVILDEEQIAFDAINQFRAQNGLPMLQYDVMLSNASREWSRIMRRSGFRHGAGNENIAMNHLRGYDSALRVVEQWKNSSGHRRFLLSSITDAGIGYDDGYWTFRGRAVEYRPVSDYVEEKPVVEKTVKTTQRKVITAKQILRRIFR
jgi:hypothetical protein